MTKIARRVSNAADGVSDAKRSAGIYEFPDAKSPGSTYVGQSREIPKRLKAHEQTGKKSVGSTAKTTPVLGGRTSREIAEYDRIQKLGGVKGIAGSKTSNIRNPIGRSRKKKLGLE